jgi:hypothetical protein
MATLNSSLVPADMVRGHNMLMACVEEQQAFGTSAAMLKYSSGMREPSIEIHTSEVHTVVDVSADQPPLLLATCMPSTIA